MALVGFLLSERAVTWRASAGLMAITVGTAYAVTIVANTTRIVIALSPLAHPLATGLWTAARIHRLEGVAVYFAWLMVLHFAVARFARSYEAMTEVFRGTWLPLICYYFVTILVPLANGAGYASRSFLEHIAFVVLIPPTLVGVVAAVRLTMRASARIRVPAARGDVSTQRPA